MSVYPDLPTWIAIVPARAGSVGIPGKNRRLVGERSLVEIAMDRGFLIANDAERVIVTTDDPVVADLARYRGHRILERPAHLATAHATIAEVVDHAVATLRAEGMPFDHVAVCQPTSPLLSDASVVSALSTFAENKEFDSLATVVAEPHLLWTEDAAGRVMPAYSSRTNRQFRDEAVWRETGGLFLVRDWIDAGSLVSRRHHLHPIPAEESVDVDAPIDLALAEILASRRTVEWRVVAGEQVGYGHLFRCLTLADEMPHHAHRFVLEGPAAALALVADQYPVVSRTTDYEAPADLVVIDTIYPEMDAVRRARDEGSLLVGIEIRDPEPDLEFDLYLDELHDPAMPLGSLVARHVCLGPAYASLRDEFRSAHRALDTGYQQQIQVAGRVLISFGGSDPARLTERALEALYTRRRVLAVIGPGFDPRYTTELYDRFGDVLIAASDVEMAREMLAAQVVVTSGGRTLWEAASLGCSLVSIYVNDREARHAVPPFARRIAERLADRAAIRQLVDYGLGDDATLDARLARRDAASLDGYGPKRIAWLFDGLIRGVL